MKLAKGWAVALVVLLIGAWATGATAAYLERGGSAVDWLLWAFIVLITAALSIVVWKGD